MNLDTDDVRILDVEPQLFLHLLSAFQVSRSQAVDGRLAAAWGEG